MSTADGAFLAALFGAVVAVLVAVFARKGDRWPIAIPFLAGIAALVIAERGPKAPPSVSADTRPPATTPAILTPAPAPTAPAPTAADEAAVRERALEEKLAAAQRARQAAERRSAAEIANIRQQLELAVEARSRAESIAAESAGRVEELRASLIEAYQHQAAEAKMLAEAYRRMASQKSAAKLVEERPMIGGAVAGTNMSGRIETTDSNRRTTADSSKKGWNDSLATQLEEMAIRAERQAAESAAAARRLQTSREN